MTAPLPHHIAWFAPWTWKRGTWGIVTLLVVLVGYPLSFGPALYVYDNTRMDVYPYLRAAYYPLWRAVRIHDGARAALEWYGNLFLPGYEQVFIEDDGHLGFSD